MFCQLVAIFRSLKGIVTKRILEIECTAKWRADSACTSFWDDLSGWPFDHRKEICDE